MIGRARPAILSTIWRQPETLINYSRSIPWPLNVYLIGHVMKNKFIHTNGMDDDLVNEIDECVGDRHVYGYVDAKAYGLLAVLSCFMTLGNRTMTYLENIRGQYFD